MYSKDCLQNKLGSWDHDEFIFHSSTQEMLLHMPDFYKGKFSKFVWSNISKITGNGNKQDCIPDDIF